MALRVDYYTSLSRAVAGLDREAYAARGAVYDREHKALLRRLFSADPPHSDEDIEKERQAFRDAIRRIEFGDEEHQVTLVPQREEVAEEDQAPAPATSRRQQERDWSSDLAVWSERIPARDQTHWSERKSDRPPPTSPTNWAQRGSPPQPPWLQHESPPEPAVEPQHDAAAPAALHDHDDFNAAVLKPKRKSITRRILGRTMLAAVLLGILGYAYVSEQSELPSLSKLAGDSATAALPGEAVAPKAVIYDTNPPNPDGPKAVGTAVWRLGQESSQAQQALAAVLQFDLKIPERQLNLAMSMRREAAGSTMSHMVELRFLREDGQPDRDIENIGPIIMTTVEQQKPSVLTGQVVKVTPGVFLFGLSGLPADRERNEQFMKELTWLDVPVVYRNGVTGVLAVEKGPSGDRAVKDAFGRWAK